MTTVNRAPGVVLRAVLALALLAAAGLAPPAGAAPRRAKVALFPPVADGPDVPETLPAALDEPFRAAFEDALARVADVVPVRAAPADGGDAGACGAALSADCLARRAAPSDADLAIAATLARDGDEWSLALLLAGAGAAVDATSVAGATAADLARGLPAAAARLAGHLKGATLVLRSAPPGAAITLDGGPVGRATPAVLTGLAAGRHEVALALADHAPATRECRLVRGQLETLDVPLLPVLTVLHLEAVDAATGDPVEGARVAVGELRGTTPFHSDAVPAGLRELTVESPGYAPVRLTFTATGHRPQHVRVSLVAQGAGSAEDCPALRAALAESGALRRQHKAAWRAAEAVGAGTPEERRARATYDAEVGRYRALDEKLEALGCRGGGAP